MKVNSIYLKQSTDVFDQFNVSICFLILLTPNFKVFLSMIEL